MEPIGNGIDARTKLMASATEVWRAIMPPWQKFYEELSSKEVLSFLCEKSLIARTEMVREAQGETGVFFRQERLPFLTYPFEWSYSMFHDAAVKCLDLHESLFRQGYCLLDSHPWNFVFSGPVPLWVDVTSISAYDPQTARASLRQFGSFFLNPLWLLAHHQPVIARSLLTHTFQDLPTRKALEILPGGSGSPQRWPFRLAAKFADAQKSVSRTLREMVFDRQLARLDLNRSDDALRAIAMFRRQLAGLPRTVEKMQWTDYVQAGQEALTPAEIKHQKLDGARLANQKMGPLVAWLEKIRPECATLVDLACNKGLYAQTASMLGYQVAGIDIDEGAVESMYVFNRDHKLKVVSAINDCVAPLEACGMVTNPMPAFARRVQADCGLFLALIHHLYFGRYQMSFENISRLAAMLVKKYAVIEFVPPTDSYLAENYQSSPRFQAYDQAAFMAAIQRQFEIEATAASFPEGRTLWLLKEKTAAL